MAIRLPAIPSAKRILRRSLPSGKETTSMSPNVPKGYAIVYIVEEHKKRFVVPLSYLSEATFQYLLNLVEEEFKFNHPMDGLTIPCREEIFIGITSQL